MKKGQGRPEGIMTFEGVVDHGQIRLKADVLLPDNTKVYVVVPDIVVEKSVRLASPRLADQRHAADFKLEIVETGTDDGV